MRYASSVSRASMTCPNTQCGHAPVTRAYGTVQHNGDLIFDGRCDVHEIAPWGGGRNITLAAFLLLDQQ